MSKAPKRFLLEFKERCTRNEVFLHLKDFLSTCDQIRRKLGIWSFLLKKSLMENFIFCTVEQIHLFLCKCLWILDIVPHFFVNIKCYKESVAEFWCFWRSCWLNTFSFKIHLGCYLWKFTLFDRLTEFLTFRKESEIILLCVHNRSMWHFSV